MGIEARLMPHIISPRRGTVALLDVEKKRIGSGRWIWRRLDKGRRRCTTIMTIAVNTAGASVHVG